MRTALIKVFVLLAGLCGSIDSSHAELKFEPEMAATCKPATPVGQTLLKWRSACPKGDCFVWRVSCGNGKSYEMQSRMHPATTELQSIFYEWAPWSFMLYLLPFAAVIALALIGVELSPALIAADALFIAYELSAAWALYASITGNPWDPNTATAQRVLLNPYLYGGVLIAFALANAAAAWRGVEFFFFRHAADAAVAPILAVEPMHAAALSMALMPDLYELIDPRQSAAYYRRETEHLRAMREKLDAQTALAQSILRNYRARNEFDRD